jgi:ribonucleoside-diphosphate reductase alpha chain
MPRPDPAPAVLRVPNPLAVPALRVCPDCAGPLAHSGGCVSCRQCGWGRCG